MKKFIIPLLTLLPILAAADSITDIKSGKDLVIRSVGGVATASALGTTQNIPLLPSTLGKVVKAAGTLSVAVDLYTLAPVFNNHSTVTFAGTETTANHVKWAVTDPGVIGKTLTFTAGGTTYSFTVSSFGGNVYQAARPLSEPIYDTFDAVNRGTEVIMDTAVPSAVTMGGTIYGFPATVTLAPQLTEIGGTAVTVNFPKSVSISGSYLSTGSTQLGTVALNTVPTVDTSVNLTAGPGINVPASVTVLANHASANFNFTVAAGLTHVTASYIGATLNGYTAEGAAYAKPLLSSIQGPVSPLIAGGVNVFTVYLGAKAPTGGAVITLHSLNANDILNSTVTVPAGASSATFNVLIAPAATSVILEASYAGASVYLSSNAVH